MRLLTLCLALLFIYLQALLWVGPNSWFKYRHAKDELVKLQEQKEILTQRNNLLETEVKSLSAIQRGYEVLSSTTTVDAIEERARLEQGMVKPDEHFYRIIPVE